MNNFKFQPIREERSKSKGSLNNLFSSTTDQVKGLKLNKRNNSTSFVLQQSGSRVQREIELFSKNLKDPSKVRESNIYRPSATISLTTLNSNGSSMNRKSVRLLNDNNSMGKHSFLGKKESLSSLTITQKPINIEGQSVEDFSKELQKNKEKESLLLKYSPKKKRHLILN